MFRGRKGNRRIAGLALHEDSLRYVELYEDGEGLGVLGQERLSLPEGYLSRGAIARPDALKRALRDLKESSGGFTCPVVLGLPAGEVILKQITYPRMPLSDVRDALSLEFEKHFPYAWEEAVADVAEVEVPAAGQRGMTVLAAASRRTCIDDILGMAERMALPVHSIEPMNVAFFRAVAGREPHEDAYFVLGVGRDSADIILGYRDNAILYRSILSDGGRAAGPDAGPALEQIVRNVQETEMFVRNQYRGLSVSRLVLGGDGGDLPRLKALLNTETSLSVEIADAQNLWDIRPGSEGLSGYDAALGLALRNWA